MQTREWMTRPKAQMGSVAFIKPVNAHLTAIRTESDLPERAREACRFGGFLRSIRSPAGLKLAEGLIQELKAVPTQRVGLML